MMNAMNMNAGRYHISLWVANAGPRYYDQLDMAFALDIEDADVHNSGRSMAKWYGVAFMPCRWKHYCGGAPSTARAARTHPFGIAAKR